LPVFPEVRVAVLVGDGEDQDRLGFEGVYGFVRKSVPNPGWQCS
jgi:hypothetical protein